MPFGPEVTKLPNIQLKTNETILPFQKQLKIRENTILIHLR